MTLYTRCLHTLIFERSCPYSYRRLPGNAACGKASVRVNNPAECKHNSVYAPIVVSQQGVAPQNASTTQCMPL
eukprot:1031765-Pyramimonas_sp.AAC.1